VNEPMAITESGAHKPVAEFSDDEKWWCDCDSLDVPHVHTPWGAPYIRAVDLLTGMDEVPR